MAARTRKIRHDDLTRARIKTSQLVNRLQDHVAGKVDLSSTQVTAALGLLKKSLPDLATTTLEGNPDRPIITEVRETIVDPGNSGPEGSQAPAGTGPV